MPRVAIESDPPSRVRTRPMPPDRTFYARYWGAGPAQIALLSSCPNCALGLTDTPWNILVGDQREPIGLRYAARYFEGPAVISFFDVWRSSAFGLENLENGGDCDDVEPTVLLGFFDEDENVVTQIGPGPCPSPCTIPPAQPVNFPYETQRVRVNEFELPTANPSGNQVGWVTMSFVNPVEGTSLDQAWVAYEFDGSGAFVSAHFPGVQLDPSACEPINVLLLSPPVQPVTPSIPGGVDGAGDPPAGFGPGFAISGP